MRRMDIGFLILLGLVAAWMAWFDYADPADLVAREFLGVLGGMAGLYAMGRIMFLDRVDLPRRDSDD